MSWLWEKSSGWRWIVASGRASGTFMMAFAGVCFLVPWVVGQGIMNATNYNNEQLQTELLKRGRDRDSAVIGRVNKERLAQFLGEIQRKENTEDRYKAALRGETLTGTPEARIRGGGGTSMQQGEDLSLESKKASGLVSGSKGASSLESKAPDVVSGSKGALSLESKAPDLGSGSKGTSAAASS